MLGPISRASFSLAVATLLSTVTVGTANAKECKADSDCGAGFQCALVVAVSGSGPNTGTADSGPGAGAATGTSKESSGGGGAAGSSGSISGSGAAAGPACAGPDCTSSSPVAPPLPVDAGPVVVTTGTCQVKLLSCTIKADCPANLDCVKQSAPVPTTPCRPGTTCDTTLLPPVETGTCKAVCNVDADCPAPLVCKLQGVTCSGVVAVSADGTVTKTPETCTGGTKICSYQPVICSSDTECTSPNTQCAKVSEYQTCTSSGYAGCARASTDGGDICATTSEPPVCTSTAVNNCIPKQINCDAGQTCPAGSSCFDFTNFDDAAIPGWTTPMPSKGCLPDGLILVIKGQASGSSGGTYIGSEPTRGNGSDSIGLADGGSKGSVTADAGASPQAPVATADAGTKATSYKPVGSGCTLAGSPRGSSELWLTLGLAGMALGLVRRRK